MEAAPIEEPAEVDEEGPSRPEPGNSIHEEPSHDNRQLMEGDQPRRRRRRRGGRRHRRHNAGQGEGNSNPSGNAQGPMDGNDEEPERSIGNERDEEQPPRSRPPLRQAPQRIPPKPPHRPQPQSQTVVQPPAAVVRTGSADKHLVSDEPIAPQPISRPRSYRDLDAIPDDYD
jgi:ribonuclease E